MKEPLEFFVATIGWGLLVFAMVGFLHLCAVMESTALQKQDMHLGRAE